jgi:tRNA A-37 threonylcarbamoyl transferase component Bud32
LQATNAVAASQDFAKTEFPARVVSSLSRLLAIAEGLDADGSWILSDIVSVGNAVVGEKLRALLSVIQGFKSNEAVLQRRTADLVQGNPVVAQLQERIQSLELDGAAKRKQLEALSMQLDIERDQRASPNRLSPDRGSTSQQIDLLQRELQMVSDTKAKLEEDNMSLKRKVIDVEDSNNQLRKQLVDTRREAEIAGPRSAQAAEQEARKDSEAAHTIQTLSSYREAAETKAQMLAEELRMKTVENTRLKEQLGQDGAARAEQQAGRSDLLQLIQLRAGAEKRAEEAETALKLEQHAVWKLKQELKMMETRLSEMSTRGSSNEMSSGQQPSNPRDSSSSVMSGLSTSPASFELQRMQRELKVMAELKEAALQSLDSLRSEMVDGVTNIEFSHLRIDSKIGSGSFAEVYRGEWTRPCAIKKLRGLTRRRQLQDFYREAQILQMLNHNGIVQLMGICMNIPELYLVTELVVGGSLEDLLHIEKRKLTLQEILSICMQIADAMQFLHMANIVHRDLKPSNCLIDHTGVVKLCDFGLARVLSKEPSSSTSDSARAGTPVYLAPEALQGAPTTNKVDVYSFAIICWEMITGQQAWVSLDYKQMVAAVLRDRKRPPVPPDLKKEWRLLMDSYAPRPLLSFVF